jgi:hypothetical protein
MSAFTLDTSGVVAATKDHQHPTKMNGFIWPDPSPFAQGYVEAALRENSVRPTISKAGARFKPAFCDLAPVTLAAILKDCEVLASVGEFENDSECGDHTWKVRQAGRWPNFPPLTLYLADDGLIYQREAS